jgi:hypothetical protein
MKITYLSRVTDFNQDMLAQRKYTMIMTVGNGSMVDEPRVRGWVVHGDNFAKWFPNLKQAQLELSARI